MAVLTPIPASAALLESAPSATGPVCSLQRSGSLWQLGIEAQELTNAIGAVFDHVDDIVLTAPHVLHADVEVRGAAVHAIVAVEVGGEPVLPFTLSRDAAEDVFRTVATEPAADRRLNPGLPPSMVDDIVPAACALVAVMRRLHLDRIEVVR